ncbi:NHL repeat-containing protein [Hydrogenophaga soli]
MSVYASFRQLISLMGAVVLASALSACGGSGSDASSPGSGGTTGGGEVVVKPTNALNLLAGAFGGLGAIDGVGSAARFCAPSGVAVDRSGSVYVADQCNDTIRKITPDGVVTTFAGSPGDPGSTDGVGSVARFRQPSGIAVDSGGTLYVADQYNSTIRKVTPDGVVTTLAGRAGERGRADGIGSAARFDSPYGLAVDGRGNVYVTDSNTIRKITPEGMVTTLAGSAGESGNADGSGSAARFSSLNGVAVDSRGNVYATDATAIRKITPEGVVTTWAGRAGELGSADGPVGEARFGIPIGIAVDSRGEVYVADAGIPGIRLNNTIRKITSDGLVTTLAGSAGKEGSADGRGSAARFNWPKGLAVDASGNVYVADSSSGTIRKINPEGMVTTLAGRAKVTGSEDGSGGAARFELPQGLAVDSRGNVYVSDSFTIRKVTPEGAVTTLAGRAGERGNADGPGSAARFNSASGVTVDGRGNLYVADTGNNTIRKVTPDGVVTTLAGRGGHSGIKDGIGSAAEFGSPQGLVVDSSGNVYVAEYLGSAALDAYSTDNAIRKITPEGMVTTLAGRAGQRGSADGSSGAARFDTPVGIAVDGGGNLYVADSSTHTIRKISTDGMVTTLAGRAYEPGSADGLGSAARFNRPRGLAVDSNGTVYVADTGNSTIRKITPDGVVSSLMINGLPNRNVNAPIGIALSGDKLYITTESAVAWVWR